MCLKTKTLHKAQTGLPVVRVTQKQKALNRPLSILKFSSAARPRGHKQRKLNEHVCSFLLSVSSKPHYQAEFKYIESRLLSDIGKWAIFPCFLFITGFLLGCQYGNPSQ